VGFAQLTLGSIVIFCDIVGCGGGSSRASAQPLA
jgi:hypothetical protein